MREMMTMQGALDKFFEDWRTDWPEWKTGEHFLALDVDESDDYFLVTTDLPGVNPDNINITVHDDMLTINAEIPEHEVEHEEHKALVRERHYGRYSRSIRLPQAVDAEKVEADYVDGTLKLTLPKTADSRVKVIPVKTGK
jgi:HSP20 family protein